MSPKAIWAVLEAISFQIFYFVHNHNVYLNVSDFIRTQLISFHMMIRAVWEISITASLRTVLAHCVLVGGIIFQSAGIIPVLFSYLPTQHDESNAVKVSTFVVFVHYSLHSSFASSSGNVVCKTTRARRQLMPESSWSSSPGVLRYILFSFAVTSRHHHDFLWIWQVQTWLTRLE